MGISIDEAITRYKNNAEYERTHGNLQGCLEFRQLAEWLEQYQKLKADYENRLKADMVAMLTEIQLEIEEMAHYKANDDLTFVVDLKVLNDLIEQKIDKLKGDAE